MKFAARGIPGPAAIVLLVLMSALGCGSDESSSAGNAAIGMNNGGPADAGGVQATDTSQDTTGDTRRDADRARRYEPALADLGAPSASCPTTIVNNETTAGSPRARIFVPSYRIDFDVLSSHQTFREHIHQLVHEKVLPCRLPDRATVVLFPESIGLPMLLIGDKASSARQMDQSNQALTSMIDQIEAAYLYYGERFPDSAITNRFLLALTDSVVRATYDTFGQIADRYGIYVSVTVDLPAFEKTTDPAIVERLGDPDYDAHDYVYQATDPKVYNRQILFGPHGEVVDETLKTYVTGVERDLLGLAAGDFSDIHLMQTPWGMTGVVISKSAKMPDVQDRLDDLGAEVIFQPQASADGWITRQEQAHWEPDRFLLGGWNLVQRAPRATYNYVSQLTGNFFDFASDGQVQFIEKASRQGGSDAFVGQHGALSGNTFIGPWVVEDPVRHDPTLTLAERREELRDVGAKLLPGSDAPIEGEYVEDMWAADLRGPVSDTGQPARQAQVQTHPQVALLDNSVYVVSSKGRPGARRLSVERYENGSVTGAYEQHVSGYDLVRPALAVGAGKLHVVAELIGDGENRLAYTAFDPAQQDFVQSAHILDERLVGRWAFHPSITVANQVMHLGWIKRVGDANRAFYAQTSIHDPFSNLSVNTEVAPRPSDQPVLRANQWDARVAAGSHAIAVVWLDFQNWQWEVLVSVSTDGGLGWSEPTRLDTVPDGVEALNSTPSIASLGERRFLVAWTDARATRPNTRIASRRFSVDSNAAITLEEAHLADASAPYNRWMWRPTILVEDRVPSLVYEVLDADTWAIARVGFDASGAPTAATTVVAPSASAKHFASAHATSAGSVVAFEEVQPHTGTASSVAIKKLSP